MYGMSVTEKQQRILAACNKGGTPTVLVVRKMTALEKNNEMMEIFSFKLALTNKINWNRAEVRRIKKAANKEEDINKRRDLKNKMKSGEALIEIQMKERNKLATRKIAAQLHVSESLINYRYSVYVKKAA